MGTLDPRKEILDHIDRPAGGCYESQGMLKRVNHIYLTQKKNPVSDENIEKKIGFNSNTLRHRTATCQHDGFTNP